MHSQNKHSRPSHCVLAWSKPGRRDFFFVFLFRKLSQADSYPVGWGCWVILAVKKEQIKTISHVTANVKLEKWPDRFLKALSVSKFSREIRNINLKYKVKYFVLFPSVLKPICRRLIRAKIRGPEYDRTGHCL